MMYCIVHLYTIYYFMQNNTFRILEIHIYMYICIISLNNTVIIL